MIRFSQRLENLAESETLAMSRLSRELKAQGKDVINLSLGEPDFDTPEFIKTAAKKAIDENFSHYTPVPGYDELLDAISHKFKRDNGLEYSRSQILASTGAKQSIANLVLSVINEGDEVLVPAPYWVSYREIIKLAGGIPVVIEAGITQDFKVTAEQVKAKITPKSRMFLFSSPCNPTGSVYSYEELKSLAEMFAGYPDILIVADEIYELINFGSKHHSIGTFEQVKNQVVTINGLSKGFAMTGWRLGYIGAPEAVAKACIKMQGQFTSATCSITQRAAITALMAPPEEMDYMKEAFEKRRNMVYELLKEIKGLKVNMPVGAFYFFPDITAYLGKKYLTYTINTSEDLCMYLLHEANVALVSGSAFGAPEYIRLSYAASEAQLTEALKRLKIAFDNLQ